MRTAIGPQRVIRRHPLEASARIAVQHASGPRGDVSLSLQTPNCSKMLAISRPDAKPPLCSALCALVWDVRNGRLRLRQSRVATHRFRASFNKKSARKAAYNAKPIRSTTGTQLFRTEMRTRIAVAALAAVLLAGVVTDQIPADDGPGPLLPRRRPRPRKDAALRQ